MLPKRGDRMKDESSQSGDNIRSRHETPVSPINRQALRITLIYLIVGALWILLSDNLVQMIFKNSPDTIWMINLIKGWFYVLVTAGMIFGLTFDALKKNRETQQKIDEANAELARKQALLQALINSIPDLIFYKDTQGVYLGCNTSYLEYEGLTETDIVGKTDSDLFSPERAGMFLAGDKLVMHDRQPQRNEEAVTYPDGRHVWLDTLKTPYYDDQGRIIGLIGISRDISERKQREEEIQYLNYHDTLTGLYNRAFLLAEQDRLDTVRQLPLSVIMGDINGLKLINDALGHAEGDRLLMETAEILKKSCRAEDIIARIGGDEFCILLPKTDAEGAQMIINRIKVNCDEYMRQPDKLVYYTNISLGYATKTEVGQPLNKIQKTAEDYMYKRKLLEYKSLHSSILSSIKTTMFEKSNETEAHAERLAELSQKLGRSLGLSEDDLVALVLLSTLHDIGKISIDRGILTKADKLIDEEWAEMQRHPEVGYRITQASPELRHISDYILCHHERYDGTGYPQGLAGENIPLLSRILAVVDAYDAMTEDRAYRKAMSKKEAVAEILNGAGTQFDPLIAKTFVEKIIG